MSNEILNWSNPIEVKMNAIKYLGKDIPLYYSTRKDKKYMVISPDNKIVHFGQQGYEDYTKHKDEKRRSNYLSRATKIKGNWATNKYSPNMLSIYLLWNA
jgi:hypothetical protein